MIKVSCCGIYFWFTGPLALTLNIMKNTENSSIVVQWDEVDDSLTTTYIVNWTSNGTNSIQSHTLIEQSSYTITGLILHTAYTITVAAANMCGTGPENITSVLFTTDTFSRINPTLTASINPMTINSNATITSSIATTTATYVTDMQYSTINTTAVVTTITPVVDLSIITSKTTSALVNLHDTASPTTIITDTNPSTVITSVVTSLSTPIVMFSSSTVNPANTTRADETSKFKVM